MAEYIKRENVLEDLKQINVIGNIYDNPELLEGRDEIL